MDDKPCLVCGKPVDVLGAHLYNHEGVAHCGCAFMTDGYSYMNVKALDKLRQRAS